MASRHYQSHSCVPVVCAGFAQGSKKIKAAESFLRACGLHRGCTRLKKNQKSRAVLWCSGWFYVFNFIDWCNLFSQHHLRALSAKNANHLQTTDTLKRHQRYSIHYHCGWPSLGIWGSATHNGLPALPEPFLRACGLHRVCTRLKKNQSSRTVLWCSGWFYVFNFIDWCNLFFHVTKSNKGKSKCGGTLPGRGHKSARCRWNRLMRSSSVGDCNVYESQGADNHQDRQERSSVVPEVTPTRSGDHATHPEVLRTLGWSVLWPKTLRGPNVTTSKRGKWTWTPQL